ncbi:M15 family metallopeptidase [Planococcus lenghuensis]|uniref:D-alanyl-D-alanine carboxypeptidase n=1 Tax=Planococcus lenghuensis TaxID=2213202 RepID=A0A1Q2KVH5_9BACL|nr:M15 family metallopeptidase [Planococcus lenghuensis]AQQ52116.1 D-alanyl-D-alanine carboxypeptidase [Planococcus lenghuensis]
MATRYKKNKRKNVSVYIWSILIILLTAGAAGAGAWLGVYAAQQSASQPEVTEETGGIAVTEETEQPEEEEKQPVPEEGTEEAPETEDPLIEEPAEEEPVTEELPVDRTIYPEEIEPPAEPTIIQGVLLANKQYPLPEDYAPGENAEARAAFEQMAAAAEQEGIELVAFSTYRSFARQKELYEGYAARDGAAAADRYSARPGHSEHQTGLAFDIGEEGQEENWASSSFGETAGGEWLADNAHKFGFILRYPEGKEKITGYMYESWHFRYVGEEIATAIHEQGLTLEEYLDI